MERPKKEIESSVEPGTVFVSQKEFDGLKDEMNKNFSQLIDLIQNKPDNGLTTGMKAKAEESKKVDEAAPDTASVNPRYDAKAKEVLGDRLERTYVTYPKGGGTLFTIVIDRKFSNAPKDYLERMKEDRRTVNIEREEFRGEDGVEKWAKIVLQNLNRTLR